MRTPLPVGQVGPVDHVRHSAPAKPEVEDDDPYEAMFVSLPSPPGFDAMGAMARCMVEEYAMMGFSAPLLMKMFKNPFYHALHRVYQARGEEYVQGLLVSVFGPTPAGNESAPRSDIRDPGVPHA